MGKNDESIVPEGILRSQEAYWRDLPRLLPLASKRRQWVAYCGDTQIALGATQAELYSECLRRGFRVDEVFVGRLRPSDLTPWQVERIECASLDLVEQSDKLANE